MKLEIYSKDGTLRTTISPADSSTQSKELAGDNVLSLSFTLYEYIALDVNDYIDFMGERYWLTEQYEPTEKSSVEWQYDVKFYGIENMITRYLVVNDSALADNPAVFTLTDKPEYHLQLICDCINNAMGTEDWKYSIADDLNTQNIVIDYDGTYCDEALEAIAEALGDDVEWWVDGQTINIGSCSWGEAYELGYGEGKGLTTLERTTADNVKFYTRLYVIGSTRNITAGKNYDYSRLMLPGGAAYLDVADRVAQYGIIDNAESDAFADIYPSYTFYVKSVRKETATDDDGNEYYIYYVTPTEMPFDPDDCLMDGEVIHLSFQSGELNGLGTEDGNGYYFEANWHADTGEFELITIWPYDDDTQLPNDTLIPAAGDTFILWNMNMPEQYITDAENRLLDAANAFNEANCKDPAVYKGSTDWIWTRENLTDTDLGIGHKVRLVSSEYFDEGYRDSRITKITRKVTLPWACDLEIGDVVSVGKLTSLQDTISSNVERLVSASATVNIIKTGDATKWTDYNVLSSLRTKAEFISKTQNDTAKGLITFSSGIKIGDYSTGSSGAQISAAGNAEFDSVVARSMLRSTEFVNGFTGEGFRIAEDNGLWYAEFDYLTVRRAMNVYELLINKVRSVAGMMVISCANGKIKEVGNSKKMDDGIIVVPITLEEEGGFVTGDFFYCQQWNGTDIKEYFGLVHSVSDDGLTIYMNMYYYALVTQEFINQTIPTAGDELVQWGNNIDSNRQGIISLSAAEDGQPRIDILNGVGAGIVETLPSTSGCLRTRLGCLDGISDSYFPEDLQPSGYGLYADNCFLHGTFVLTTGNDILTQLAITEGNIQSTIIDENNLLNNGSFASGTDHWTISGSGATLVEVDGHNAILLSDGSSYIEQANSDFKLLPSGTTDSDGNRVFVPVTLTFKYRIDDTNSGGALYLSFYSSAYKYGYKGFSAKDDSSTTPLPTVKSVNPTGGEWVETSVSGYWDGQGSLRIASSATAANPFYLYGLKMQSGQDASSIIATYSTLFNQAANLVEIAAAVYDKDANALAATGLVIKPDGNGLFACDASGNYAFIGTYLDDGTGRIQLSGDQISLEGFTTVNSNFQIDTDGYIVAKKGGTIGGFVIGSDGSLTNDASGANSSGCTISFTGSSGESLMLQSGGIIFGTNNSNSFAVSAIGTGYISSAYGFNATAYFDNENTYQSNIVGVYSKAVNSYYSLDSSTRNPDMNAMYGAHALFVPKGDICGFRLRTRRISSSTTLSLYDSIVLVSASGVTLTLPTDAEDGQLYLIMRTVNSSYTVSGGGNYIYSDYGSSSWRFSSHTVSDDQPHLYIFDAGSGCWRLSWFNMN